MRIHPLMAGAAVSVMVLSGVGVAAITGYLPGTHAEKAAPCEDCAVVIAVRTSQKKGEGTGAGAVIGGVAGAVVGREIADGRDAGTLLGAAGGALAGHQIERHARSTKRFHVDVRMEDGTVKTVTSATPPRWKAGDRVRVQDGKLLARS
jgi:outer membrane lipoprotein SlyB